MKNGIITKISCAVGEDAGKKDNKQHQPGTTNPKVLVYSKQDEFNDDKKSPVLEQAFPIAVHICSKHEKAAHSGYNVPGRKLLRRNRKIESPCKNGSSTEMQAA